MPATITFTRASSATYFGADGLLKTAANNEARFDHHPGTGAPRGLLLEGQRTNLLLHNRDLTNAIWNKTQATVAKTATGIDGVTNSAIRMTATGISSYFYQQITGSSGTRVFSIFVRRVSGSSPVRILLHHQISGAEFYEVPVTSDWTRVSITRDTQANPYVALNLTGNGDVVEVDYAQLENGVFSSSAIATEASQATRSSDNLLMGDVSAMSFNPSEGTVLVEYDPAGFNAVSAHTLVSFSPGTSQSDVIYLRVQPGSGWIRSIVNVGGNAQGPSGATTNMSVVGAVNKAVMSWKAGELSFGLNGELVTGALGGLPTGITRMRIGGNAANGEVYAGHIRRLTYWPTALPHTQLVNLMQ